MLPLPVGLLLALSPNAALSKTWGPIGFAHYRRSNGRRLKTFLSSRRMYTAKRRLSKLEGTSEKIKN